MKKKKTSYKQIMKALSALDHKLDKLKKSVENPKPISGTIRHSDIMEEPVRLRNFYQSDEKKDSPQKQVN